MAGMEQVHGVDVSWMTQGSPKDRASAKISASPPARYPAPALPRPIPSPKPATDRQAASPGDGAVSPTSAANASGPQRRSARSGSLDKQPGPNGTPPQRRNTWFSNISAKFSNSPPGTGSSPQPNPHLHLLQHNQQPQQQPSSPNTSPPADAQVPRPNPPRNAVLQHAAKPEGDGPYTPAPPRSAQAGFLGVFRRLSASSGSGTHLGPAEKIEHGLVDRRILNVDKHRERCPLSELSNSKLRRVSFCVDVEIAPMPKYAEAEHGLSSVDKTQKRKTSERAEGEALKNPVAAAVQKEDRSAEQKPAPRSADPRQTEPDKVSAQGGGRDAKDSKSGGDQTKGMARESAASSPPQDKDVGTSKKKEKKKKSEEERKARKEKKRKLAEANGSIPLEIHYESDCSSSPDRAPTASGTPKPTTVPTTNPVRIYRRCCQLRETPILKKITEQLLDPANSPETGVVSKLDLTGYWLQLPDLVTLGDYLAVVPVRQIILENCGLGDEGLRVVLAGLLAAKSPSGRRDSRRRKLEHGLEAHSGVVERVVLKSNKLGPDGWKHLCLFLYLCRSLKYLDISHVPFPRQASANTDGSASGVNIPRTISELFSKALEERLGGSTLELINMGDTEPSMEQLGIIMKGIIACGVRRLGLAHNSLDEEGVEHVVRYVSTGICEGLDLGGNQLNDHIDKIASAIKEDDPVWALSLAGCNLTPSSLSKMLQVLVKLKAFKFVDLSHNHDLFQSKPNAVGTLRRYLPKMRELKRIHLQDVGLTAEQAIALVEVVPDVRNLAHVNILDNAELVKLANPRTEEAQEEACALYASLMAAARVSNSLIAIDIEVPSEEASEVVKAMAKQVVAYCLRNMEKIQDIAAGVASALSEAEVDSGEVKDAAYPDVIAHLVGHDSLDQHETSEDTASAAPDEDYVIGGTGVVKALACCLQNRGDESRRPSGEYLREAEGGESSPRPRIPTGGKAREMSKHLLASARQIRRRLQPSLNKARAQPGDESDLRKLIFLDETLQGIIKRFEDEYPDTREAPPSKDGERKVAESSTTPLVATEEYPAAVSDGEDEAEIHPSRPHSRSNSVLSRTQAEEEGRVLRAGHRFRWGYLTQQQIDVLTTIDDIGSDPNHIRLLHELAEEIGGEFRELVQEKGVVRAYKDNKERIFKWLREDDPDHWERFKEAQQKARANITVSTPEMHKDEDRPDESAILE